MDVVDGSRRIATHSTVVNPNKGEIVVAGGQLHSVVVALPSVAQIALATVEGYPTSGERIAVAVDSGERVGEIIVFRNQCHTH